MSDGFEKLKEIGAQKIHEKTHITREHVQAILHDSFEGMNKIQFLGFISILERDYDIKLNDLKIRGLEYFLNIRSEAKQNTSVFVETKSKTKNTPYIIMALLVLVITAFFIFNKTFSTEEEKVQEINNDAIEHIKNNLLPEAVSGVETNSSAMDENSSTSDENNLIEDEHVAIKDELIAEKQVEPKSPEAVTTFKVIPNAKLWMGYIDLKENKAYQKLFSNEFSLDTGKDWLLYLGHGNVNFEINGKILQYNSRKNLKLLYKDNNLTEVSNTEFNILKKDHKW